MGSQAESGALITPRSGDETLSGVPVALPQTGQSSTTVTQSGTLAAPTPWLSSQMGNFLAIALTVGVGYLAYHGDTQAQAAVISGFSMLVGLILGARLALKIPGKDV